MSRIDINKPLTESLVAMSDRNPGAASVLKMLINQEAEIDPDSMFVPIGAIMNLDQYGIYGSRIWVLFKNGCRQNLKLMIAALRAVQLGIMDVSALAMACDEVNNVPIPDSIHAAVRKELPKFAEL